MMKNDNNILDIIEQTRREIQKTKKVEKKLNKIITKPFNKTKSFIKCIMFMILFMLSVSYIFMFLVAGGYGEGRQWITDIIKESSRQTITTALHIVDIMVGFLVGRQIGKVENKDNQNE